MAKRPFSNALADAADGIINAFREEPNFRIQIYVTIAAVVLGFALRFRPQQWAILGLAAGLVLCAELFNTCLEHFIDLEHPEPHPVARAAKHAGAAAVLVTSLVAMLVGIWLFGSALIER